MIRFSCSDYTFPLLARRERLALLKLLGFAHVDIGFFERSADLAPSQLLAGPKAFTRKLQSDLKAADLQVADIFLQTGPDPSIAAVNDPRAEVRARNRKIFALTLDLCAAVGSKHLTGLPGVQHDEQDRTVDLALAVEEGGWRQHAAAQAGVTYAVEPHIGSICSSVAATRALLYAVPGLTLTLDYGHFVVAGVPSREVHPLLPFATHLHFRGGAPHRLQTPLDENQIDFAAILRRLLKRRYSGFLAVEYVYTDWQDCNRTDNVSETILLRRHLEDRHSAYMKKTQLPRGVAYA